MIDAGDGIVLRPTRREDVDWVLGVEGHPDQRPWVTQWSRERHERFMGEAMCEHRVVEQANGRCGYLLLRGAGHPDGSIELVRLVVTRKGAGIGRRVLRATLHHAFDACGAHRLWLDVFEHNERARGLYSSEGFVEEGMLRECVLRDGAYRSLIVMSVLEHEFAASPAATES